MGSLMFNRLAAQVVLSLVLYSLASIRCEELIEPPFPQLLNPLKLGGHLAHIVSEVICDSKGYETLEEFADLRAGKATIIANNQEGSHTTFSSAESNVIYIYRPYSCDVHPAGNLNLPGYEGLWHKIFETVGEDGKTNTIDLFGVVALWLNAGEMPKSYSKDNVVFSASKNVYKQSHKWTVGSQSDKYYVHFYFMHPEQDKSWESMTLEMIQVESVETKKIIRTLNILTYENSIPENVYDNLLQLPIGYGCVQTTVQAKVDIPSTILAIERLTMTNSHHIELEVTSTLFDQTEFGEKQRHDTINVELARGKLSEGKELGMIRQSDTKKDIKTVMNYDWNIQYKLDLRKDTCEMSNMGTNVDKNEKVAIEFSNGLKLDIDVAKMEELFRSNEGFEFVKSINRRSENLEYLYFEKTSEEFFKGKFSRIIRTYSRPPDGAGVVMSLDSVTIWVFRDGMKLISEIYHLNVINSMPLQEMFLAKVFDISDECYLNNDKMRAGRDYAWFELSFPVPGPHLEHLAGHTATLKYLINLSLGYSSLNFFRVPKVELLFESTGFVARFLLLDLPPLTLRYESIQGMKISLDKANGDDSDEITVDLEHCADLCRLRDCKAMSFCANENLCALSNGDNKRGSLVREASCTSLFKPQKDTSSSAKKEDRPGAVCDASEMSLHRILGMMRHQDYSAIPVPEMPDELVNPSGLSVQDIDEAKLSYSKKIGEFLYKEIHRVPMLSHMTYDTEHGLILLVPNKFELEQDPFDEFELADEDQSELIGASFHKGVNMHRYKSQVFDGKTHKTFRIFTNLEYDQCALACVDSKCSSFSFCSHRQECILTDIYDIGANLQNSTELDADCFIAQRDFLSKFNRFQDVYRPNMYKKLVSVLNPSECAHMCMIETTYNCLAFDYCTAGTFDQKETLASCFLLDERHLYSGSEISTGKTQKTVTKANKATDGRSTGCDHYSRSYLADFIRIEYRRLDDIELSKLKSSVVEGRTVDRCAEICANELSDCTAFQFCFDPEATEAKQKCTMIESAPKSDAANYKVTYKSDNGQQTIEAGKFFYSDDRCHVFAMRKDSEEANHRSLALSVDELGGIDEKKASGGISLGSGFLLYICLAIAFAGIGCGLVFARHHNEWVRQKFERLQILLGR